MSRHRIARVALVIAVAAGLWLGAPQSAVADSVAAKRFHFEERDGMLAMTAGFREMFDAQLRKRLRSGFATVVVMRVFLYEQGGGRPVAVSGRTIRAVYDLWEQSFLLKREEPQGLRYAKFRDERAVVDRLTSFWRFPVVDIARIDPAKQYFVAAIVEVNPMRPEVLAEVRRWLRRPASRQRRIGSESFFGSFVSIFVNDKIRRAEKSFKVRSQPFFRRQ